MRVIAVSYCYAPMPYPQSIQIGRLLDHAQDVRFTVFAGPLERGRDDTLPGLADPQRVVVMRVPWGTLAVIYRRVRRLLGGRWLVPDAYRGWARDAGRDVQHELQRTRPDVLVTFGQPMSVHLVGLRVTARTPTPWVAHFSDPWVDNPFDALSGLTRRQTAKLERAVLTAADLVVFTSQETVDLVMAKYDARLREKVHVLPHSYDPRAYQPPDPEVRRTLVMRYLGSFYGPRTPRPLLDALSVLQASEPALLRDVRIELIGGNAPAGLNEAAAVRTGLVTLHPAVSSTEATRLMADADLLLVIDAPAESSPFLPSKLIDYIGSGRPVLAITPPGASARVVREHSGWIADPQDGAAVVRAIREAITAIRSEPRSATRRSPAPGYAARQVARQFVSILQQAVGTGS